MAIRGPRFSAVPSIPREGTTPAQYSILNALKENVELLTGVRGVDKSIRALFAGQITVDFAPPQNMRRVSAEGTGFVLSPQNVSVASIDDYTKLILDVQELANDVARLRQTVNTLISQLRAE